MTNAPDLETRLRLLEVAQAVLEERTAMLTKTMEANTKALQDLTEALNKGKGAWWILAAVVGTSATLAGLLMTWFKFFRG